MNIAVNTIQAIGFWMLAGPAIAVTILFFLAEGADTWRQALLAVALYGALFLWVLVAYYLMNYGLDSV